MLGASFHDERTSDGDKVSKFLTQLVAGPSQSVGFCESTKQESVAAACLPILRTEQRVRASCQELKFITSNFFKARDAGTMRLLSQNSDENVKPTKIFFHLPIMSCTSIAQSHVYLSTIQILIEYCVNISLF